MHFQTPEEFIRYLEHTQGELKMYDGHLDTSLTEEEFHRRLYETNRAVFDKMYGSSEAALQGVREHFQRGMMIDQLYQPRSLEWAKKKLHLLMGTELKLARHLRIAPVSIPVFNAAAVRSNDGHEVILINQPLLWWLGDFDSLLWDAYGSCTENQTQRLYFLRDQFRRGIDDLLSGVNAGLTSYRNEDLAHFRLAGASLYMQTLFVLLHELAHVVLGHLSQSSLRQAHPLDAGLQFAKYYTQSQTQEFEADEKAAKWLFSVTPETVLDESGHIDPENYHFVGVSMVLLFAVLAGIESATDAPSDTHPPALERAAAMTRVVSAIPHYMRTDELMLELIRFFEAFIKL